MRLLADIFLLLGAVFVFLGALGLLRMPDVYNRLQVTTKAVTLGVMGIVVGMIILFPQWWTKLIVILGFILLTSPVSSTALAHAFLRQAIPLWQGNEKEKDTRPKGCENTPVGQVESHNQKKDSQT